MESYNSNNRHRFFLLIPFVVHQQLHNVSIRFMVSPWKLNLHCMISAATAQLLSESGHGAPNYCSACANSRGIGAAEKLLALSSGEAIESRRVSSKEISVCAAKPNQICG
jgi:hypothetical protein